MEDKYIAFTSGLTTGASSTDVPRLMLLVDWLRGMLGDTALCQRVARLVVCGVPPPPPPAPVKFGKR